MKKVILTSILILFILNLGSSQVQLTKKQDYVKLLSNTDVCLVDCETVYEVCSPQTTAQLSDKELYFKYKTRDNYTKRDIVNVKSLTDTNILVNTTVLINKTCHTYDYYDCSYRLKNESGRLVNKTCHNKNYYDCGYYKEEYKPIPQPLTIGANECIKLKIQGKKAPLENIDNILHLKIGELEYSYDEYAWWNGSYDYRFQINVTNQNDTRDLKENFTTRIQFDHATYITSNYCNQTDGDDVRILYNDSGTNIELHRINISAWNTATTTIAFKVYQNISPSTTDTEYSLYCGSNGALSPPQNISKVYLPCSEDFDHPDGNIPDYWTEVNDPDTMTNGITNGELWANTNHWREAYMWCNLGNWGRDVGMFTRVKTTNGDSGVVTLSESSNTVDYSYTYWIDTQRIVKQRPDDETNLVDASDLGAMTHGAWYYISFNSTNDGCLFGATDYGGSTITACDTSFTGLAGIGVTAYATWYYDNLRVYHTIEPSPTVTIGEAEQNVTPGNNAPTITLNHPANDTAFSLSNPHILNVTYNDADSEVGNVTFYNSSDTTAFCSNLSVTAGNEVYCALTLQNDIEVKWYVNATDGTDNTMSGVSNFSINPLGTLSVGWFSPTISGNHTQNTFTLYQAQVNCTGGSCGVVNITLDPATVISVRFNVTNASGMGSMLNLSEDLTGGSWTATRNSGRGTITSGGIVGNYIYLESRYAMYRGLFPMNTTDLPDDANIQSAQLIIRPYGIQDEENDGNDFIVIMGNTTQGDFWNINAYDFDNVGNVEYSDRIDLSNMANETWQIFNFTSTGISNINKTGITKLGMKEGHDVMDDPTTTPGRDWFMFQDDNSSIVYLEVNYTEASKGIIPNNAGETPFWSNNATNTTTCGTMTDGNTCFMGINVNATGTVDDTYEFFWDVNSDTVTDVDSYIINITIVEAVAEDSCTYTSGDWDMDCSDNCEITSDVDLGDNNLYITGTGTASIQANITNCAEVLIRGTDSSNKCEVTVTNAQFCT